ncbi:MAG: DUF808 domain-containing protein [Bacteroidota bacterium]
MASGFFAILDDIAALMDDVAINTKIATKNTVGILGDDLAVNAEKSTGVVSSRELPILWAITKGSFLNKLIIVPITLLLNYFYPPAIIVILLFGGLYLAYEGVEKIVEYLFHSKKEAVEPDNKDKVNNEPESSEAEKSKISSAITTDFILSIEIVIVSLSSVIDKSLTIQILTLALVSIIATVGVYGIVALVVRMDDAGIVLIEKSKGKGIFYRIGLMLVKALPIFIRVFSVIGTIALLLVAGGIFSHNLEWLMSIEWFQAQSWMHSIEGFNNYLAQWSGVGRDFVFGFCVGLLAIVPFTLTKKIISIFKK